jgi:hypothetical protein
VAPFLVAAPIALVAAGVLGAGASADTFLAINTPRLVAITHALVLGWITTTMMGATYQLGPVVLGGRLMSISLARLQFVLHAAAVATFIWYIRSWDIAGMSIASVALVISLVLYLVNAGHAVWTGNGWSLPRSYLAVSLACLAAAGAMGITYVGTLEHLWFPVTFGRLASHAHLGLVGWLALTLMGVSYQLVPMFNVATRVKPRFGYLALAITGAATALFVVAMQFDPPAVARVSLAVALAAGPLLWGVDQLRFLWGRSRRRLDIQGRATIVSLAFLALAVILGVGAALGTPLTPDTEMARWPLAYGVAAILGWAGTAVIGNGIKITAFLVWFHRYQPRAGTAPVPLLADLYNDRFMTAVIIIHAIATSMLVAAALAGSLPMFRAGATLLALCGTLNLAALLGVFVPREASDRSARPQRSSAP